MGRPLHRIPRRPRSFCQHMWSQPKMCYYDDGIHIYFFSSLIIMTLQQTRKRNKKMKERLGYLSRVSNEEQRILVECCYSYLITDGWQCNPPAEAATVKRSGLLTGSKKETCSARCDEKLWPFAHLFSVNISRGFPTVGTRGNKPVTRANLKHL